MDRPAPRARSGPFLFGLFLIGLGTSSALAAQTGLTMAQSGSILLAACAAVALIFLIIRSSRGRSSRGGVEA
jgi:hypothetical protein